MIIHCIILYEISNTDIRDRKTSDAEDWGRGDGGGDGRAGLLAEGLQGFFWDENVLNLVMVAHTWIYRPIYPLWVNFMACKLYKKYVRCGHEIKIGKTAMRKWKKVYTISPGGPYTGTEHTEVGSLPKMEFLGVFSFSKLTLSLLKISKTQKSVFV